MGFNNEELTQQAQNSASNTVGQAASPIARKVAQEGGKRAGRAISKGVVKAGKAIGKGAIKVGQALIKAIIAAGPIGLAILGVILLIIVIVSAAFNYQQDERGSSGQLSLDPVHQNPTSMTEDGYLQALALTEPQALIDAYYKYMSCNSHQKVYYDAATNKVIDLQFDNADETSDFASLMDLYEHERAYYLSSYFIKMTDELLHEGQFYYPEQVIKPVFAKFLPLEDDPSKKYITTLPIVDDDSPNAKALKAAIEAAAGTAPTDIYGSLPGAYAIKESLVSDGGEELKNEYNENATKTLLAVSKVYEESPVTLIDASGTSVTQNKLVNQGSSLSQGVWDYGFGSILQYEPMIRDKYISCSKASFNYHLHKKETWTDEDGTLHENDTCYNTGTYEIRLGSDTVASIKQALDAKTSTVTDDETGHSISIYVKNCPSDEVLSTMLDNPSHVEMKVVAADKVLAGRIFSNDTLQAAFGNGDRGTMAMADKYPLKVAVLNSVATFSGNIRYVYEDLVTSEELTNRVGTASDFAENWIDDCTKIKYSAASGSNCTFEGEITRAGQVNDQHPSPTEEIKVPMGFQYLEGYDNHYEIYVSDLVNDDRDFQRRIQMELAEYAGHEDQDMNDDKKITIMDYMLRLGLLQPYFGGALGATGEGSYSFGSLTTDEAALMQQAGCTPDADGEVELLAKAIAAEAGPNKLDQLMVASVVVNRVHSPVYPKQNTIIAVLSARGQYSTWPSRIMNANPTDEMRSSARQVLSGEFATPSNMIFQAGFLQGDGTFLINVNGPGFYTHYYCYKGAALSTLDIFGRPAITNEASIRALAEELHQKDITNGVSNDTSNSGITTPGQTVVGDITSDYPLFAVGKFDTISAIRYMQNVAEKERSSVTIWDSFVAGFKELCGQIFSAKTLAFGSPDEKNYVNVYKHNVALSDMQDTVIQAVTFINQDIYSTVADEIDTDVLQFIFVGDYGGLGTGTTDGTANWVPGVGSTFDGFGSPTNSHYNPSENWSASTGQVVLSVPEGEVVVAVGEGTVTSVSGSGPYEVTMKAVSGEKNLTITYGNLKDISVANGQGVSKGTTIGHAGSGGLILKLLVDGVNVDPMDHFYRPQFSTGVGFTNLLDASGNIDNNLVKALKETLNTANSNITNTYDTYHTSWRAGGKSHQSVGECTWWAYGRGLQYCEQKGTLPADGFKKGYGNGGDYKDQATSQFQTGNVARAGAWIVWKDGSYGHVAFVEAVGADGSIVISQSGRGYWDYYSGAGINVSVIKNSGSVSSPNYRYGNGYRFVGFVYLDQPK